MEIEVRRDDLSLHDTGGGTREVRAVVIIDSSLSPRLQRKALFHEVLGCLLENTLDTDELDAIAEELIGALDQLEAN